MSQSFGYALMQLVVLLAGSRWRAKLNAHVVGMCSPPLPAHPPRTPSPFRHPPSNPPRRFTKLGCKHRFCVCPCARVRACVCRVPPSAFASSTLLLCPRLLFPLGLLCHSLLIPLALHLFALPCSSCGLWAALRLETGHGARDVT